MYYSFIDADRLVSQQPSLRSSASLLLLFVVYPYVTHHLFDVELPDLPSTSRLVNDYNRRNADKQRAAQMIIVLFIGVFSFIIQLDCLAF